MPGPWLCRLTGTATATASGTITPSADATLTLARIWATLADPETLHSKETGAVWALARLPPELRRPLELALESYRTHGRDIDVTPDENLLRSVRNIAGVELVPSGRLTARQVADADRVVATKAALEKLQEALA